MTRRFHVPHVDYSTPNARTVRGRPAPARYDTPIHRVGKIGMRECAILHSLDDEQGGWISEDLVEFFFADRAFIGFVIVFEPMKEGFSVLRERISYQALAE